MLLPKKFFNFCIVLFVFLIFDGCKNATVERIYTYELDKEIDQITGETMRPTNPAGIPAMPLVQNYPPANIYGAGLSKNDGTVYVLREPTTPSGTITAESLGLIANDNTKGVENRTKLNAALANTAYDGKEILFSNGTWYFVADTNSADIIALNKDRRISLRGQSRDETILKMVFDKADTKQDYAAISGRGIQNIVIKDFTITSAFYGNYSSDLSNVNPTIGNLAYGIQLNPSSSNTTIANITKRSEVIRIENVRVENFSRMGVILRSTQDVRVKNCIFQNATDVAGGGAGYGVAVQGLTNKQYQAANQSFAVNANTISPITGGAARPDFDFGKLFDSQYNVIEECAAIGPYIRHAYLIQYNSHNNLVINNMAYLTGYDSIDLHGEDEYLNEICYNLLDGTTDGAGMAVGNSGAGHSWSGPSNYFHHNTVQNAKRGMDIMYGTPDTIVENNTFTGIVDKGIYFDHSYRSIVSANTISSTLYAIYITAQSGYSWASGGVTNATFGAGSPTQNVVINNTFNGTLKNSVEPINLATLKAVVLPNGKSFNRPFLPKATPDRGGNTYTVNGGANGIVFTLYPSASSVQKVVANGAQINKTVVNGKDAYQFIGVSGTNTIVVTANNGETETYTFN